MSQSCGCVCVLKPEFRQEMPEFGESVFVSMEKLLARRRPKFSVQPFTDHPVRKYRSNGDRLFTEVFPCWWKHCRAYYHDRGPQLRGQIPDWQIAVYDQLLCCALLLGQFPETWEGQTWGRVGRFYSLVGVDRRRLSLRVPPPRRLLQDIPAVALRVGLVYE